jgi:hypothetical protein
VEGPLVCPIAERFRRVGQAVLVLGEIVVEAALE